MTDNTGNLSKGSGDPTESALRRSDLTEAYQQLVGARQIDFVEVDENQKKMNRLLEGGDQEGLDALALAIRAGEISVRFAELANRDLSGLNIPGWQAGQLVVTNSNLSGAIIPNADFTESVGTRTDFRTADIRGMDAVSSVWPKADMRGVKAQEINLTNAVLINTVWDENSDLRGARLAGLHLVGAKGWDKVKIDGAITRGLHLSAVSGIPELPDSQTNRDQVLGETLTSAGGLAESAEQRNAAELVLDISNADLAGKLLSDIDHPGLVAREVLISESNFTGSNFVGANFDGARGRNSIFRGTRLSGASFVDSRLRNADFADTVAPGSDFTDADLRDSDFRHANVAGSVFDGADIRGVIGLDTAVTTGASFNGAIRTDEDYCNSQTRQLLPDAT